MVADYDINRLYHDIDSLTLELNKVKLQQQRTDSVVKALIKQSKKDGTLDSSILDELDKWVDMDGWDDVYN